jgi:hypothetical protein
MTSKDGGKMYRKFGLCVLTLGLPVFGTFAPSGTAQVVGSVVTQDGQPIPGALVELWATGEVIESTTTGADGRFSLRDGSAGLEVRVSRLGFEGGTATIEVAVPELRFELPYRVIELPPLLVEDGGVVCRRNSSHAEGVWASSVERYTTPSGLVFWAAEVVDRRSGIAPLIGRDNVQDGAENWMEVGSSNHPALPWSAERVSEDGFVRPGRIGSLDGRTGSWDYPRLEGVAIHLFLSDAFREHHDLFILEETTEEVRLGFCPRNSRVPAMKGNMDLEDGWVRRIEWQFSARNLEERAGGIAEFDREAEHLFPVSAVYWRDVGGRGYFQEHLTYGLWVHGNSQEEVRRRMRGDR